MKILITGGAGFIGSTLCKQLSEQNHQIIAFDNFSRKSHLNNMHGIETYDGDVRQSEHLHGALKKHGQFDALWHLAYINGTSTFYSNPELVLDVGVKGAINTLDLALEHNIKNYILCSTSEVYNEPTQVPTPENERILIPDIHNPRFSYSGGKIISELLAIHYGAKQGLETKIFRPHNIYGSNMGTEHVIPQLIKKILFPNNPKFIDQKLVVPIQGTGLETRSFCYIEDAIRQMIMASNDEASETAPIYNIGNEDEISINQLALLIADILNIQIVIDSEEKPLLGSSGRRCPSMNKLNKLGYKSSYNLRDGLTQTIEWYKKYFTEGKL